MQKRDIYNHEGIFGKWKEGLTDKYIEENLSKQNSKFFVDYFIDIAKKKSIGYVNRNRSKVKSIFIGLQNIGMSDIRNSKSTDRKKVEDYFFKWCENHSADYVRRWNAIWNWLKKENRRNGKVIEDLTLEVSDFKKGSKKESVFVWLKKEEFDKFRSYFDEDKQTILYYGFDTIIRFPTEASSVLVENHSVKNGEVWVNIPKEISKTIGRKFNLLYCGDMVLDYIKRHELKPEDYLFNFSPSTLNKEMQKVAKQIWGDKKSEGGEYYKNITLYDLRHSGAIHFRQLFQQTGQSLDLLRERGGWSDFDMINYYTKMLGLDGHIDKEKTLLQEDKTQMQKKVEELTKRLEKLEKLREREFAAHELILTKGK